MRLQEKRGWFPVHVRKDFILGASIALVIMIAVLVSSFGHRVAARKPTCGTYRTWAEANEAYHSGQRQLDGDGDGLACESKLPAHLRN